MNNDKLGIDSFLRCWSPPLASASCQVGRLAYVGAHEYH